MARCLVTGHKGYIGSRIVKKLQAENHETIGIDLVCTKYMGDIRSDAFLNASAVWAKFKPEYIFHCAAKPSVQWSVENPSKSLSHNVYGTSRVLEFAKMINAKRVIFSSSAAVYGNDGKPCSPYGAHKYMSEIECKLYAGLYDIDTVSLRYFNVFSKDQKYGGAYSTVIAAWNYAARNNKPLYVDGDGFQSRDFIHVDDIVDCNIFCMNRSDDFLGNIYDVGTGESLTLNNIKQLISSMRRYEWVYRSERQGDVRQSCANNSALKIIGWSAKKDVKQSIKNIFGG
tara:strand:+ start:7290 stop:8144 length:855 start_codon:yes stop_codon:yes gene_type:complete